MPLIQRLLQRDAGSPSLEVEPGPLDSNKSLRSSLPESAFLDILSALKPLPEFPRLLATVNEQGQTLLHLAIHLRYRQLFQKLVHWGIDLNVRDVNGFTALHVGYLCDDAFVIGLLEAVGATPFVLDELGRPPTELAASTSGANGIATGKDREMVPLVVGYTNRPKEQRGLLGRAIPAETQETAFGPAAEKGHPLHTEIRDVPDRYLIPSVQPIAVGLALNANEDIERHIGYNDKIRWFCIRCNEKSGNSRSRIRDHVAACLGYDIYPCTGECGNPTWCVALSVDWASEILDANYHVTVGSNAKRVRIFVSTSTLSAEYAHSGTSDFTLGAFADQHEFLQW